MNMEENKLQIIETQNGSRLVVGSQEYEILHQSFIDLKGKDIPKIEIGQLPEDIGFFVYWEEKYVIINSPPCYAEVGNVEIWVDIEIENKLQLEVDCRLGDFLEAVGILVEEGSDRETGQHFASVSLPSNRLDVIFENVRELIDEFWRQNRSLLKRVDKDMGRI